MINYKQKKRKTLNFEEEKTNRCFHAKYVARNFREAEKHRTHTHKEFSKYFSKFYMASATR